MAFKAVGVATSSILTIQFATSSGSSYLVNADATPTLTISTGGSVVSTITTATNTSTGAYSAAWTPAIAGEHSLLWSFAVEGVSYSSSDTIFVLTAASSTDVSDAPDVGTANTCLITGTFIDAAGDFLSGIRVRFSPDLAASRLSGVGFIASDLTATSGANGQVSFAAVRGIVGLLTISGTDLVRRVTIPSQTAVDLFDLASTGPDLLEVQELELLDLPRRS